MKKACLVSALIVVIICLTAFSAVYAADGATSLKLMARGDRPSNLSLADDPPDGAKITILSHGNNRTVIVSGFPEIYKNRVEIYGKAGGIEECPLINDQCTYRAGRWLNFPFRNGSNYSYVHVVDQYQIARQSWMGQGVCVMPDFGKGAAIIACDDLAGEYKQGGEKAK